MVTLSSAETRVNRANINYEYSQIDCHRRQKLFDKNVAWYKEFKTTKVGYDPAKEELAATENNLELIKNSVTKKAVSATNTLVRSTIDGMALAVPAKKGNSAIPANTFNAGHYCIGCRYEKRKVKTGLSDAINIEITGGLKADDKVKGEKIDPKKLKEGEANQG